MKTKICTKCKRELDITNFSKRKDTKDGLNYICKGCKREYDKEFDERKRQQAKENKKKKENVKDAEKSLVLIEHWMVDILGMFYCVMSANKKQA